MDSSASINFSNGGSYYELENALPDIKKTYTKITHLKSGTLFGGATIASGFLTFAILAGIFLAGSNGHGPSMKVLWAIPGAICGAAVMGGMLSLAISEYLLRKKRTQEELKKIRDEAESDLNSRKQMIQNLKDLFDPTEIEQEKTNLLYEFDELFK